MKFNTDPQFVGVDGLIERHAAQMAEFDKWAEAHQWMSFHHGHYDWWAFPIDQPSSYGFRYVVYEGEIAQMKEDSAFMGRFRRGVELLALAWGWDVYAQKPIATPEPGQSWQQWAIRLHKAANSSQLFGQQDLFHGMKAYALTLIAAKESFWYNGRDLSLFFMQ